MVADMKAVADAAGLERFVILGPSQGFSYAVAFAVCYPGRVAGIIGRGGFAQGWLAAGDPAQVAKYMASRKLIEMGWNDETPEFRRFFTARLYPDADAEAAREFDELQRKAVDAATMMANVEFWSRLDLTGMLGDVRCPGALTHSHGDRAVHFSAAQEIARLVPHCDLHPMEGDNHTPVPGTPGFDQFVGVIDEFLERIEAIEAVRTPV